MKKKIIILIIILILLISGGLFLKYILSFRDINLTLSSDISSLAIFNSKNIEITKINTSQSIKLQTGNYRLIPTGERISNNDINIAITKDETINIDPDYSPDYLNNILEIEKTEIQNIFNSKYPTIIGNYSIKNYQLFKKGEWFGGLLVKNSAKFNNQKDIFRFVANKKSGVWEIINYPDLILTVENYPDVPKNILNLINSIEYEY